MMDKITATLKLFNGIENKKLNREFNLDVLSRTLPEGYILDSSISPSLIPLIRNVLGFSAQNANASFHKSWDIVRKSNIETLVLQQIFHYLTTYGFESVGMFDGKYVYIPKEILEIPDLNEDINFIFVKSMSHNEILSKIISLGSGIALSKETLECIMAIVTDGTYSANDFSDIKNRELLVMIYDFFGEYPSNPEEFLRFVIYKLTGETLIIKNDALIEKIKQADYKILDKAIGKAPLNLSSIFFRYKPLFLAMKHISHNKTFFNKLRKLADVQHVPMGEDYLNSITGKIANNKFELGTFYKKIDNYNVFRKIRLLYALNFRLNGSNSIVYKIRNGKGWVSDFHWNTLDNNKVRQCMNLIIKSIANDIKENVEGKTFFIPNHVHYAIPSTEKQFVGNIPANSYIEVDKDLIFGVHWFNKSNKRVDLDLSLIDLYGKYGWDASYRSSDRQILFSGDITNAPKPHGASELFYVGMDVESPKLINLNYFNHNDDYDDWTGSSEDELDYKFFIGSGNQSDIHENYMIDMNKMMCVLPSHISKKQNTIGLVMSFNGRNRIYFSNVSIGNNITSKKDKNSEKIKNYFVNYCNGGIDLETPLIEAGANIIHELPEDGDYIDLSPHALDKETIIKLFL
jgi:hypothetical protein